MTEWHKRTPNSPQCFLTTVSAVWTLAKNLFSEYPPWSFFCGGGLNLVLFWLLALVVMSEWLHGLHGVFRIPCCSSRQGKKARKQTSSTVPSEGFAKSSPSISKRWYPVLYCNSTWYTITFIKMACQESSVSANCFSEYLRYGLSALTKMTRKNQSLWTRICCLSPTTRCHSRFRFVKILNMLNCCRR